MMTDKCDKVLVPKLTQESYIHVTQSNIRFSGTKRKAFYFI